MIRLLIAILGFILLAECWAIAPAAAAEPFDPVTAGARGLKRAGSFPWYDSRKENVAPVDVQLSRDSLQNRSSTWLKQSRTTGRSWSWWSGSKTTNIFEGIGWFLLAVVLAALVGVLGWAIMQREGRLKRTSIGGTATFGKEAATTQLENLPFPLEPTELDLLAEARRHFQAGDYEKAIIYLFSYQLVQLDHRQLVRLTRGKTNRQYLRELRTQPFLRSLLEQTMIRFEDVFFGGRNLTRGQFASCWDRLSEFHQHVEQPAT